MADPHELPPLADDILALLEEAKPIAPETFASYIAVQHRRWLDVGKAAAVIIE